MEVLVLFGLCVLLAPFLVYGAKAESHAAAWAPRALPEASHAAVGVGPFRATRVGAVRWRWTRGGMPWSVTFAAISCYALGQMVVPSVPVALFGGFVGLADGERGLPLLLLALAAIPGVIAAVQLWRCGNAMVANRVAYGADQIDRAVRITLLLNVPLFALAALMVALRHHWYQVFYVTLGYAPLSIAQALFVRVVWRRHATRHAQVERANAEAHALGLVAPAPTLS